jgi:hypothetical protein
MQKKLAFSFIPDINLIQFTTTEQDKKKKQPRPVPPFELMDPEKVKLNSSEIKAS